MTDLVARAMEFAERKHRGLTRKDGQTPAIGHPARVVGVLAARGVRDEEVLAAAWLHDTVEDTDATHGEIRANFGERVSELVRWLTKPPMTQGEKRKTRRAWTQSFEDAPPEAVVIKFADRLDNLNDWKGMSLGYRQTYLQEAARILAYGLSNDALLTMPVGMQDVLASLADDLYAIVRRELLPLSAVAKRLETTA